MPFQLTLEKSSIVRSEELEEKGMDSDAQVTGTRESGGTVWRMEQPHSFVRMARLIVFPGPKASCMAKGYVS